MKRKKVVSATTLVEVLLAVIFVAVSLPVVVNFLADYRTRQAQLARRVAAFNFLVTQMEMLIANSRTRAVNVPQAAVAATVPSLGRPAMLYRNSYRVGGDANLYAVTYTVSWDEEVQVKTVSRSETIEFYVRSNHAQ